MPRHDEIVGMKYTRLDMTSDATTRVSAVVASVPLLRKCICLGQVLMLLLPELFEISPVDKNLTGRS